MTTKKRLEPIVNDDSKILILGTFPGEDSIAGREYYSGTNNLFWNIVFASQPNVDVKKLKYKDKVERLKKLHIALWDIYEYAERKEGSSKDRDISLVPGTYKYNDVFKLLKKNPSIKMVALNGILKDAQKFYSRFLDFYKIEVIAALQKGVSIVYLPSTPGFNRMKFKNVKDAWLKALPLDGGLPVC